MPSFSNDASFELPSSPPTIQDLPHRPSHEKSIMSNAFVFTNGVGEETGRESSQLDGSENNLKNASLHSLPNGRASGSVNGRDRAHSRTGSPPPVSGGAVRSSHSGRNSPGPASGKSRQSNGDRIRSGSLVNGGPVQPSRPRSPSKRTINGDRTSDDQQTITLTPMTTHTSLNPSQYDSNTFASGEPASTISNNTAPPLNRFSSPPIIPGANNTPGGSSAASLSHAERHRLTQRHTLQVPKLAPTRSSRDFSLSNPDTSEDALGGGRFSPTVERARRASLGLVRRTTRSIHSDLYLDDVPQDEDAARWTEAIRQKRASRKKRKEEEDDERVIVGTKVDQNHVNWVTAYNMLTGIRFTVSRTNAKMDRELTDADFAARHKFSFDM
jgi:1-phosphatidylinositol-4-phosphate 5-kinase